MIQRYYEVISSFGSNTDEDACIRLSSLTFSLHRPPAAEVCVFEAFASSHVSLRRPTEECVCVGLSSLTFPLHRSTEGFVCVGLPSLTSPLHSSTEVDVCVRGWRSVLSSFLDRPSYVSVYLALLFLPSPLYVSV